MTQDNQNRSVELIRSGQNCSISAAIWMWNLSDITVETVDCFFEGLVNFLISRSEYLAQFGTEQLEEQINWVKLQKVSLEICSRYWELEEFERVEFVKKHYGKYCQLKINIELAQKNEILMKVIQIYDRSVKQLFDYVQITSELDQIILKQHFPDSIQRSPAKAVKLKFALNKGVIKDLFRQLKKMKILTNTETEIAEFMVDHVDSFESNNPDKRDAAVQNLRTELSKKLRPAKVENILHLFHKDDHMHIKHLTLSNPFSGNDNRYIKELNCPTWFKFICIDESNTPHP